jgi:AraC family transcriptional regulator, transcriptional activator of pobA
MNNKQTLAAFHSGNSVGESSGKIKDAAYFDVLDLKNPESSDIISLPYSRRSYYTITLLHGDYQIDFEDQSFNLSGDSLLFTTPKIPFGLKSLSDEQAGASCIFNEAFIGKENSGYRLQELQVFKPGQQHIYTLSKKDVASFAVIFDKLFDEKISKSAVGPNLQRIYVLELVFHAQKLTPSNTFIKKNSTAEEIACSFVRTLEQQFPITSPDDQVRLKSANDFAKQLNLHPVYLNRQVKTAKGRTVSDMIAGRMLQEAKILLKLNNWHISEIAYCLGFEEPAHFNAFFKKHAGMSPGDFRALKG